MNKVYRITRNPEALKMIVDNPGSHHYKEYFDLNDPDKENPLSIDYATQEDAQEDLNRYKEEYALPIEEYLENYYSRFPGEQSQAHVRKQEAEIIANYERMKTSIIPALKIVECSLIVTVREV